ncbi:hypothetical protein Strain138_002899 [Pseudogemmatithrix spongiicola]|uniref:Uncharacterized protein n=1 Tax=Pseudogemmatithrix spongiicola TaxID=3062599 RepID=A0AA49Q944_9BACT|nr:hypothetical protein Strain138_002899 [Gemmatimonadaceae bacterium 'strain 138']WKW16481.1 hypothetical protein Strain318_002897 [Gemmatimonadaceae bacterium 'strain 318']
MFRRTAVVVASLLLTATASVAQEITLTTDVLDRYVTSYDKEREEIAALDPKLREIDQRIRRFRECKIAFEAAGSATRSRLGALAARAGIRARCGANNESDIEREKTALREQATRTAAQAGNFTVPQFQRLGIRLERIYAYGDRAGLSAPEVEAVNARRERFGSIYGVNAAALEAALGGLGRGTGGVPAAGQWTADYTWLYIGQLWGMMYGTGANVFDEDYQPGQWTRWELGGNDDDDKAIVERAFLSKDEEGKEWWRYKSVMGGDTIVLEGLFKDAGDGLQELVRMRGRMPGEKEPNEMMVPENMTMLQAWGMFRSRPTKESVDGATVGTENVTTPAGTFSAKRVHFGSTGGRQEWWLSPTVPGGWVQYTVNAEDKEDGFRMRLIAHGSGATSELGSR